MQSSERISKHKDKNVLFSSIKVEESRLTNKRLSTGLRSLEEIKLGLHFCPRKYHRSQ